MPKQQWKAGNDVINMFICEAKDMESTRLVRGRSFDQFYECCITVISWVMRDEGLVTRF